MNRHTAAQAEPVTTARGASRLPQLRGRPMVTDGGMETGLIFHHGVDLPHFAVFPLLETAVGRSRCCPGCGSATPPPSPT